MRGSRLGVDPGGFLPSYELSDSSITLFNLMSSVSFAEFAESFGQLFFTQVPQRIFGGVETVY